MSTIAANVGQQHDVAMWKQGFLNALPLTNQIFLRSIRCQSEEVVETSRGNRAPLADMERLCRDLVSGQARAMDQVGTFKVLAIRAHGVQVECHFLTYTELDCLASRAGWQLGTSTSALAPESDDDEPVTVSVK